MSTWVWQKADWPHFRWRDEVVLPLLREARLKQGELVGRVGAIDDHNGLDTLLSNLLTSSAIEGEALDAASVRSSLAHRLGVEDGNAGVVSDRSEGLAEMMLDIAANSSQPLSLERLYQWHCWLFAENNPLVEIRVGELRGDEPMRVVSGRIDKPKVHFEAPARDGLDVALSEFVEWFNSSASDVTLDPFVRAALSHFWFVTLHPFDDGNGRLTRAIADLALARDNPLCLRLYAMSPMILEHRSEYYRVLESCQRGGLDITAWLEWFLRTLVAAMQKALEKTDRVVVKSAFWKLHGDDNLQPGQTKVLNRLLAGGQSDFPDGISAAQYQKVAKVSKATATRHLADLLEKNCLQKMPGGGRSTRYKLAIDANNTVTR